MALIRYPNFRDFADPFQEMERLRTEMNRLFADVLGRTPSTMSSGVYPSLNIREDEHSFHVQAELPGLKAEDIDISVEGNTLTLRGTRKPDAVENANYHRRERTAGKFHKAVSLADEIKGEAVEAHFENGVLKLVLPKADHVKPRKIDVKST